MSDKGRQFIELAIAVAIGFTVMVALLPSAIQGWFNVTATGGSGASWSTSMKGLWNIAPFMIVIAVIVAIVAMAYQKYGRR